MLSKLRYRRADHCEHENRTGKQQENHKCVQLWGLLHNPRTQEPELKYTNIVIANDRRGKNYKKAT